MLRLTLESKYSDNSLVMFERGQNIVKNRRGGQSAPTAVNSSVRTREYLTTAEIERLMAAASHRDATMILVGYRHGLRASELCDLQWSQVELATGRLHVRRAKNGSPSVHPMQGDEIRTLRRLQREQGPSSHVFMTERDGPMTPKAFHALFGRIGARAKMQFPIHPHMLRHGCGYALANAGHDTRALQAWLGHRNIQHTVRYTELAPDRFKDFSGPVKVIEIIRTPQNVLNRLSPLTQSDSEQFRSSPRTSRLLWKMISSASTSSQRKGDRDAQTHHSGSNRPHRYDRRCVVHNHGHRAKVCRQDGGDLGVGLAP